MIGIIDYGAGNLFSLQNALRHLRLESRLVGKEAEMSGVSRLILPGVGSFGDAMTTLNERGLLDVLQNWWQENRPILGICLGMQLMTRSSEEDPGVSGLGWFAADTCWLREGKVPHMGWAGLKNVSVKAREALGIHSGQIYYFVHSFAVMTADAGAYCDHRQNFAAVMGRGNCWGVQFHPEKSGSEGLSLLNRWRETCR